MTEMIERVGAALRAACEKEFGSSWSNDKAWKFASAAIEAMREPTEDMLLAAAKCEEHYGFAEGCAEAEEHWPAMIDAALGKTDGT